MPLDVRAPNLSRGQNHGLPSGKAAIDAGSTVSSTPPPPPPLAVMSMLRSTTELGDVGQLSRRSTPRYQSGTHLQSTRRRSGSFDSSFASALHSQRSSQKRPGRRHHDDARFTSAARSRHDNLYSSMGPYGHDQRPVHTRSAPRSQELQGLTNPPGPVRPLHSYRSLMTLRSYGQTRSMHSNSPYLHSAQRPRSYRTSPPAFGPGSRYSNTYQTTFPRAGSHTSAASSSVPTFPSGRGPLGYRVDGNRSSTSLTRLPSPAVHGFFVPRRAVLDQSRSGTPGSMTKSHVHADSTATIPPDLGLPQSPTESNVPRYYDYSESLADNADAVDTMLQAASLYSYTMDQTIHEDRALQAIKRAQTPFGTRPGSTFHPAELPTRHNRRESEQSIIASNIIPDRRASLAAVPKQALDQVLAEQPHHTRTNIEDDEADPRRVSSASRRTCTSSNSGVFFHNGSRSPRDVAALAARIHSPQEDCQQRPRCFTLSSSQEYVVREKFKRDLEAHKIGTIQNTQSTPSCRGPLLIEADIDKHPQCSPAISTATISAIVSPRPERPVSSRSRKEFRRILEIGTSEVQGIGGSHHLTIGHEAKPELSLAEATLASKAMLDSKISACERSTMQATKSPSNLETGTTAPSQQARSSTITSRGRSTIDSLLDKHIESLGLGSEPESPSLGVLRPFETTESNDSNMESTIRIVESPPGQGVHQPSTQTSSKFCQISNKGGESHEQLMPRKLFTDRNASCGASPEITCQSHASKSSSNITIHSQPSIGWQSLTSQSHGDSLIPPSVPTFMSGDLADVDTTICTKRFKIRRLSSMTHPSNSPNTPSEDTISFIEFVGHHKRSRSEMLARQESDRRRRLRVNLRIVRKARSSEGMVSPSGGHVHADQKHPRPILVEPTKASNDTPSLTDGCAELSADSVALSNPAVVLNQTLSHNPDVPNRWSSIMAAWPIPGAVGRNGTLRRKTSHQSNTSLAEPVNSTRMGSKTLPAGFDITQPLECDLKPRVVMSDLNLSVPYFDVPSTIRPSPRDTESFFEDSPNHHTPRATIRRFGLSSLRSVLPMSPTRTVQPYGPKRYPDQLRISHSCRMKGCHAHASEATHSNTIPMSDFAYRKRRVVERLKDWWQRQCVHQKLTTRGRNNARTHPGGMRMS